MTPLEIIGAAALGSIAGQMLALLLSRPKRNTELEKKVVRAAFEAGILAAADMATMDGNDELAGNMRKAVASVRKGYES